LPRENIFYKERRRETTPHKYCLGGKNFSTQLSPERESIFVNPAERKSLLPRDRWIIIPEADPTAFYLWGPAIMGKERGTKQSRS